MHDPRGRRLNLRRALHHASLAAALALLSPGSPAAAAAPQSAGAALSRARLLMGTVCTAEAEAADSAAAGAALAAAFDEIARLEAILSGWRADSELSRLNALGAGESLACSVELYAALIAARAMAEVTAGAYDPTVEPLVSAWDFRGEGRVPGEDDLAAALERVGWNALLLDSGTRSARFAAGGMGVDLGGIGKGFALDHAFAVLEAGGVRRARMNFGGEVCVISDGAPWRIAVADPGERLRPVVEFVLAEGAVSTSGQSERSFRAAGRTWGHILDPRTGRPVAHEGSVTVVAQSATQADALSTALFVMGRAAAEPFARAHPDIGVLWLERSGADVHAWGWNLPEAREVAGARLQWMDAADARR